MSKWNFKDWNLRDFVKGNSEIIKIGVGAIVALSANLSPQWALLLGIGTKAVLDIVHYYAAE